MIFNGISHGNLIVNGLILLGKMEPENPIFHGTMVSGLRFSLKPIQWMLGKPSRNEICGVPVMVYQGKKKVFIENKIKKLYLINKNGGTMVVYY